MGSIVEERLTMAPEDLDNMTDEDAAQILTEMGYTTNVYGVWSIYIGGTFLAFDSAWDALAAKLEDDHAEHPLSSTETWARRRARPATSGTRPVPTSTPHTSAAPVAWSMARTESRRTPCTSRLTRRHDTHDRRPVR
jgi:hypothetical protein